MAQSLSPVMTLWESSSDHSLPVLIVEPVEVVRAGLRGLLERAPDIVVVGEATTGEEAVWKVEQLSPAVALVGLDPSEPGNAEAIGRMVDSHRRIGVIVVREGTTAEALAAALRAGAHGYLSRDVCGDFLLEAVRVASRGGAIVDPAAARDLVACLAAAPGSRYVASWPRPVPAFDTLSERESQVLRSLAGGLSNKEIAQNLGLRVGTVKTHIHHIFRKLGVSDRTSAALAAVHFAELPSFAGERRALG